MNELSIEMIVFPRNFTADGKTLNELVADLGNIREDLSWKSTGIPDEAPRDLPRIIGSGMVGNVQVQLSLSFEKCVYTYSFDPAVGLDDEMRSKQLDQFMALLNSIAGHFDGFRVRRIGYVRTFIADVEDFQAFAEKYFSLAHRHPNSDITNFSAQMTERLNRDSRVWNLVSTYRQVVDEETKNKKLLIALDENSRKEDDLDVDLRGASDLLRGVELVDLDAQQLAETYYNSYVGE